MAAAVEGGGEGGRESGREKSVEDEVIPSACLHNNSLRLMANLTPPFSAHSQTIVAKTCIVLAFILCSGFEQLGSLTHAGGTQKQTHPLNHSCILS